MMLKNRVVTAVLGMGLLLLTPTAATASPKSESHTAYYSDSQMTTMVGERFRFCDNTTYSWGSQTNYMQITTTDCNNGESVSDCRYWDGVSGQWISYPCP